MNYIFSLVLFLAVILFLCLVTSKKVFLTPQFGFTIGFFISVIYAIFYIKKWGLYLSKGTFWVIGGGVLLFFIVSIITQWLYKIFPIYSSKKQSMSQILSSCGIPINKTIDNWKLVVMVGFQSVTLLWLILYLHRLPGRGLVGSIAYFRNSMFSSQALTLPKALFHMRALCIASAYVWAYLFLRNLIIEKREKKYRILLIANFLISCFISVLLGGRGGLIQIIIASVVQMYFILGEKNNWEKVLNLKTVGIIALIGCGVMASFQGLGFLLGRTSNVDVAEYLAVYISAEVKNLDTFIRRGNFGSDIYHNQTFISMINAFSGKLGLPNWQHDLDLPFRYYGVHPLGNVATTFLPFLYDYGYKGVFLLVPPMAVFSQIVFQHALNGNRRKNHAFSFTIVMYSYVFFTIFFSLFSNKFYENIVSTSFIYTLIYWEILQLFFSFKCVVKA